MEIKFNDCLIITATIYGDIALPLSIVESPIVEQNSTQVKK